MDAYPLTLTPDDNGTLLVTSPDFPELTSFGADTAEALAHGAAALLGMVGQYMDRGLDLPDPSPADGRPTVRLPTLAAAKAALYMAMRADGITQATLAERLGCDPRQVRRLLDLDHASRMDHVDAALAALGRSLVVEVRKAA